MKGFVMSDDNPKAFRIRVRKGSPLLDNESGAQPEPEEQFTRAKLARLEMEESTELLNRTLLAAERKFTALGLGVTATVHLWPPSPQDTSEDLLRFGKDGKEWRFSVLSGDQGDPPWEYTETPLMSSSRELRSQALTKLPDLHEALVKQAEEAAKVLNIRLLTANEFLAKLEEK
jgi:hypothetical protein